MQIKRWLRRGARPTSEAGHRSTNNIKETKMDNKVQVTGYIKNVQERGSGNYKVITANLSQRNEEGKCVFTMPLVFTNSTSKSVLGNISWNEGTSEVVNLIGKLVTRFDRRPGIENSERRAPYTQIEVESVS
jgi:hypothetical protein